MHSDQLLFHMEICDINHKPLFTFDNFLTTVYGFFNLLRQEGIKRCNFAQTGMPEPELHCERQLRGGSVANAKDLLVCDFFTASSSISTRETVSPRRTHCRVKQLCQSLSY